MLAKLLSAIGNRVLERPVSVEKELPLPKMEDVPPILVIKMDALPNQDVSGLKGLELKEPVLRPPLLLKLNRIARP